MKLLDWKGTEAKFGRFSFYVYCHGPGMYAVYVREEKKSVVSVGGAETLEEAVELAEAEVHKLMTFAEILTILES